MDARQGKIVSIEADMGLAHRAPCRLPDSSPQYYSAHLKSANREQLLACMLNRGYASNVRSTRPSHSPRRFGDGHVLDADLKAELNAAASGRVMQVGA
jgi:hypothetical protein